MNRRDFLKTVSAAGVAACIPRSETAADTTKPAAGSFRHRVQFGAWINDMRNDALPRDNWPAATLDENTERDIIDCLKLGQRSGYNQMDVWGLFATSAYPIEIRSAFHDPARRPRVDRILAAARAGGIKNIYGMGVYSWGFDEIIKHDPAIRGDNPRVMCGAAEASLDWQKKLIDVIVEELGVEGFHLESADQGRCNCDKCKPLGNVEWHTKVNIATADYIRAKYPGKLISCVIQGWSTWGKEDLDDAEKAQLVALSKHVDVIWDQGHRRTYIAPAKRKEFIASLHCDYGTSGGFWVYPPPRFERLRWFFPYAHRTGGHIKDLHAQGSRGVMFYQGPLVNPGVEATLAVGGRLMCDVSRDIDDVLTEVLSDLYRPKTAATTKKLLEVFTKPEQSYFAHWQEKAIAEHDKMPPPGELHLGPLFGTSPGGPTYLNEPFLNRDGRKAYRASLLAAYDLIVSCRGEIGDDARAARVETCLMNAVADIETLALAKNESLS